MHPEMAVTGVSQYTAPPFCVAVFPMNVQSVSESIFSPYMAPPAPPSALLSMNTQFLKMLVWYVDPLLLPI